MPMDASQNQLSLMSEATDQVGLPLTNRVFATAGRQTSSHCSSAPRRWMFARFLCPFPMRNPHYEVETL